MRSSRVYIIYIERYVYQREKDRGRWTEKRKEKKGEKERKEKKGEKQSEKKRENERERETEKKKGQRNLVIKCRNIKTYRHIEIERQKKKQSKRER